MALQQLSEEQVRDWTLEQKDVWWLENVYQGDMPQLTLRSALTGMMLGGVLSLTNLYVGAKTGWTLGVGITSVILAFGLFKVLSNLRLAREFTVLENNCMQSIATSAGYMTAPLISSLSAYMMVNNVVIPISTTLAWVVVLAILGVLFAFPLKRRFINEEQHPFPEGRAAGIVMDALHHGSAAEGLLKARLLALMGAGAAFWSVLKSEKIMTLVGLPFLHVKEYLDEWIPALGSFRVGGVELRELTVRLETDVVMMAAGGLMGIRTGAAIMIGAVLNYVVLAPWIISLGDIHPKVVDGVTHYGFKAITFWGLWCGVSMMTTASLYAFLAKPKMLIDAFTSFLRRSDRSEAKEDPLKDIELPMSVFGIGIPVVGTVVVVMGHQFFDIPLWMGFLAIPMVFVFTLIAAHSTALTSITPTGALGKITQLTYGFLAPGNISTNLMTAGITGEVASNSSNLLMDIKPGYMLGGKPRQQAVGHVLGIFAGALAAVPVFYLVFLQGNPQGLVSDQYPMPAATIWKAVAEVLTQGLSNLPESARWAALAGALVGILLEAIKVATRGRFWLSGVGIGLAFVIPFSQCLGMFLGALAFWAAERSSRDNSWLRRVVVENQEPLCAGLIAGGALTGIALMCLETFVLK